MDRIPRQQIRTIIIAGFVMNVMGNVIVFTNDINSLGYRFTFHGILNQSVGPLVAVAAVCAWFTLTRLEVRDAAQSSILRRAYLFFAVQYFIFAVGFNFIFTPFHDFGGFWMTTSLWLYFLGALVASIGLLLLSRATASGTAR